MTLSLICLFCTGAFDSISIVIRGTLEQVVTPDRLRGRVSAVDRALHRALERAGRLRERRDRGLFGPIASVVGGGLGTLLVVALVAWAWPDLRRIGPLHTLTLDEAAEGRRGGIGAGEDGGSRVELRLACRPFRGDAVYRRRSRRSRRNGAGTGSGSADARRTAGRPARDRHRRAPGPGRRDKSLLPYLEKKWHPFVEAGARLRAPAAGTNMGSGRMDDAVREEDGLCAGDPDWVIQQLMTKYRIDIGVLTGTMIGPSIQHDPRFRRALASAYNDWTLDKWVRPYDCFKGSIIVAAQDPEAAAARDPPARRRSGHGPGADGQRGAHPLRPASTTGRSTAPPSSTTCRSPSTSAPRAPASPTRRPASATRRPTWSSTPTTRRR